MAVTGIKSPAPKAFVQSLLRWIRIVFERELKNQGNTMAHGIQNDGFSCGIILGNTISAGIKETPLWNPQHAIYERLGCFLRLVQKCQPKDPAIQHSSTFPDDTQGSKLNSQASISVALGDHNFPDLQAFALGDESDDVSEPQTVPRPRPSIADLLNPTPSLLNMDLSQPSPVSPGDTSAATSEKELNFDDGDNVEVLSEELGIASGDDVSMFTTDGQSDQPSMSGISCIGTESEWDAASSMWGDGADADEEMDGSKDVASSDAMDIDLDNNNKFDDEVSVASSGVVLESDSGLDVEEKGVRQKSGRSRTLLGFLHPKLRGDGSSKHSCSSSSSSSNGLSETSSDSERETRGSKSRSGIAALARRQAMRRGELVVKPAALERWKNKLHSDDPHVEFVENDICAARHSACGKIIKMKDPCDASRWRTHVRDGCKAPAKGAGSRTLASMGWSVKSSVKSTNPSKRRKTEKLACATKEATTTVPCPGITQEDHERLPVYLQRTGVLGGGARSVAVISKGLFQRLFSKLRGQRRQQVLDQQQHEWTWRNDHAKMRVFAVACEHTVPEQAPTNRPLPCTQCSAVLDSKSFKNALRKPPPDEGNYIYTNHRFRSPLLGEIYARTLGLKELIEKPVRVSRC